MIEEKLLWDVESIAIGNFIHTPLVYIDIAGDLVTGVLLSQIVYWFKPDRCGKSKLKVNKDGKLWLVKSADSWYDEIRITPKQYKRSINKLKEIGIVETKIYRFNNVPTTHISLNKDVMYEKLQDWKTQIVASKQDVKNKIPNLYQRDKSEMYQRDKSLTEITEQRIHNVVTSSKLDITSNDCESAIHGFSDSNNSYKKIKQKKSKYIGKHYEFDKLYDLLDEKVKPLFESKSYNENLWECFRNITHEFFMEYYDRFNDKHPFYTEKVWDKIIDNYLYPTNDMAERRDYDEECHYDMMETYFDTEYDKDIDYRYAHFMTGGVRSILHWHCGSYE